MPSSTKQQIAQALGTLAEKKSIGKITIRDIVEECNISRQAFRSYLQKLFRQRLSDTSLSAMESFFWIRRSYVYHISLFVSMTGGIAGVISYQSKSKKGQFRHNVEIH